jgi:uncharacterized membrane protein SirB2
MKLQSAENTKTKFKKIVKSLVWILLLSFTGLIIMLLISPESKALPVFLIGFFIAIVIIVLIALYINYAVSIYKQIKED